MSRTSRPFLSLRQPALLGLAYFCLAAASVSLTRFDGGTAFIWLASAPLFAFLLLRPVSQWLPALICCGLASCLCTTFIGIGPGGALPIATSLLGEAALAAWLLRRLGVAHDPFETVPTFVRFVFVAGGLAPAVTGVVASTAISSDHGTRFVDAYLPWCAAHALGFLTLAPLLLLLTCEGAPGELLVLGRKRMREALGLWTALAATCIGVFWQSRMPLLFLPMLPLVIAAFRLGRLGAAVAIVVLATIGGGFTLAGHGPVALMDLTPGLQAQFFQFYLAVAIMIVLPVSAELRRRERLFLRLQENEASLRLLTANFADTIVRLDAHGTVRYASSSGAAVFGRSIAEVVDRPFATLVCLEDQASFAARYAEALARPSATVVLEYRGNQPLPTVAWYEAQMRGFHDEAGDPAGVVLVIRDITVRKLELQQLEIAAGSDPLTGIANRRTLDGALARWLARSSPDATACVAIFDIDRFKSVNDAHGHAAGDRVIRSVASEAQRALRATDLLARVGGEEFAVLLPGLSLFEARAVCERLRERVAALRIEAGKGVEVAVTVSLGLTLVHQGLSASAIYEAADRALYAAKHGGRNQLRIAA